MTSALQNRLVGTIIVVALIVILLPEFLDGEKRTNQQEFADVPPIVEIVEVTRANDIDLSSVEQEVTRPVEVIDEVALDEENTNTDTSSVNSVDTPANSQTVLVPTVKTTEDNKPPVKLPDPLDEIDVKDSGWVVQLGSFRHEKNVKALLKTLNDAGYRAYSNPVMTKVGRLNKVFVGPELDKETLERALPHLQEITQLKGKITAFEVSAK